MSKEAMKLALEALEMYCEHGAILRPLETRDALKEALAKQEQGEPVGVAHLMQEGFTHCIWSEACVPVGTKFYTTPQQRTWVGLTDREKSNLWLESRAAIPRFHTYASLVEAKLKEKNGA
jgi:hypothetical protein